MVQGIDRNPNYPPSEVDLPHLVSTLPSPQGDTGRSSGAAPSPRGWTEPGLRVSNLILHRRTPAGLTPCVSPTGLLKLSEHVFPCGGGMSMSPQGRLSSETPPPAMASQTPSDGGQSSSRDLPPALSSKQASWLLKDSTDDHIRAWFSKILKHSCQVPSESQEDLVCATHRLTAHPMEHSTSQKIFVMKDRKGQMVDNIQRCLFYFLLGDCISGW